VSLQDMLLDVHAPGGLKAVLAAVQDGVAVDLGLAGEKAEEEGAGVAFHTDSLRERGGDWVGKAGCRVHRPALTAVVGVLEAENELSRFLVGVAEFPHQCECFLVHQHVRVQVIPQSLQRLRLAFVVVEDVADMAGWAVYVLNAAGTLLYQRGKGLPVRPFAEVAVLQALHTTSHELRFPVTLMTTATTCLALKAYGSEDDSLLFVLETITPQGETELLEQRFLTRLDLLYEAVLMLVGRKDLQPSAFLQQERLKKELKYGSQLYESVLEGEASLLLSNHTSISSDLQQALSALLASYQLHHLVLWKRSKLYMCSTAWNDLSARDQSLLGMLQAEKGLIDRPVFLPNSSISGEEKGTIPLRFVSAPLSPDFTVGLLCGKQLPLAQLLSSLEQLLTPTLCKSLAALGFNQANLDLQTPNEIQAWACLEGRAIWRSFARNPAALQALLSTRWQLDFPEGQYGDRALRSNDTLLVGVRRGARVLWTLANSSQSEAEIRTLSEAILDYISQYLDNTSHIFADSPQ